MFLPSLSAINSTPPRLSTWQRPRNFHSTSYFRHNDNVSKTNQDSNGAAAISHASSDQDGIVDKQEAQLGGSFSDIPGATHTKAKKLAIIYTCTVCDTRSAKQFTEHSYKKGVVLVRCPGCQNLHLIADNLGWFEDDAGKEGQGWNVEKVLAKAGENNVKTVTGDDVLELTLEDVMGSKDRTIKVEDDK